MRKQVRPYRIGARVYLTMCTQTGSFVFDRATEAVSFATKEQH
jgi:hypothetical protein